MRHNPVAQRYVARLTQKHGKAKALTILAHKLARAVYYMLRRGQAFDATKFFAGSANGEPEEPAPAAQAEAPARPRESAPSSRRPRAPRHRAGGRTTAKAAATTPSPGEVAMTAPVAN